ncbi:single-strand DNA-binding protein [Curtobacterium sp. 314Chir4.1]|uniref:single-stranded DNA-binding protein n=1 Tax=Curtobacterium sp. 314Chir4.1 TaxID=1279028 RepID=UPI000BDD23AF|nr:single-stranded DNA-binding protein [Curtobacterium sp. 314Chir4.1]SOC88371.1 single-strand DNA-binding protein [Curtobacterium sp. 314Chir4.1]
MNDTITVCGIIATEPRHLVTDTGIAITSMRLASPSRRWDRATSTWTNGATNWYTVTAFRSLAANVHRSLKKGDRIVVTGRIRIRTWERDGRGGTSVEIDAEGLGHDLAWGISNWVRVPRHTGESTAPPGAAPVVDLRTGEIGAVPGGAADDELPDESAAEHPDDGPSRLHDVGAADHDALRYAVTVDPDGPDPDGPDPDGPHLDGAHPDVREAA